MSSVERVRKSVKDKQEACTRQEALGYFWGLRACPSCRLQAKLQEKEAEKQEKMMSTQHRIEELQKQADQADDLMGTLAGSRQKMSKLAGERNSHAAAALSARQALEVIFFGVILDAGKTGVLTPYCKVKSENRI